MKHRTAFIVSIIVSGGILAAIASTIAWFDNKTSVTPAIIEGSSQGAYFSGGDGTEGTPYLIKNQRHLYNLAWLQYLGEFNKNVDSDSTAIDKQYYFKRDDSLKDSGLDRKDFVLPPIGTESNPFLGNFDGNDVTINHLTVSNNFNDLNKHPYNVTSDSFNQENIQIVGFFGIIGSHNALSYSYSSAINSVSNLYLNNVTINTSSNNTLCGIFAGYANASISYCGVHYATIKIGSNITKIDAFNNVSSYTLIGDYNQDGYEWEDKPGGDVGYGTSTDIRQLYQTLESFSLLDKETGVIGKGQAVPFKESQTPTLYKNTTSESLSISTYGTTLSVPYSDSITASDVGNNIGYYSGELKAYKDKFKNINYEGLTKIGTSQLNVNENVKKTIQSSIDDTTKYGDSCIMLSAPNHLADTIQGNDGYTLIKQGCLGNYHGNILIPSRAIWVAPIQPGNFEFVVLNPNDQYAQLAIWKLERNIPKQYDSGFKFISYDDDNHIIPCTIPPKSTSKDAPLTPYYFGFSVTQSDIDNGIEFAITKGLVSKNVYIDYIDIGANGGGSTTDKGSISKLDFVTADANEKLTKLTDPGYTESNSLFSINGTSSSEYVYSFRRINDSILYYVSPIGSGFTITEIGTGTKKKTDNADCKS